MTFEEICQAYKDRILSLLKQIRDILLEDDLLVTSPKEMEEGWHELIIFVKGKLGPVDEEDIAIEVRVLSSDERDGRKGGANFALYIRTIGGRLIGSLVPFENSKRFWVKREKPLAIEERFHFLEDADYTTVPEMMRQHSCLKKVIELDRHLIL